MPRKKSNLDNTRTRKARLQRALRALESEEETATRNAAQRMRTAEIRSQESLEQREKRLRLARTARHQNIARFRELERSRQRTRRALIRGAFFQLAFDDPYVNYAPRAIGVMDKCLCHAVKFRSEACVCCASEEIVLSLPVPEPLKSPLNVKRGDGEQFLKKKRERQRRYRERNREVLREREKERRRQNRTDTRRKSKRKSAKNSAAIDNEITDPSDSDVGNPKPIKIEVPKSCNSEEDTQSSLEGGRSPKLIKKERSHTNSESARASTEDCGGYGVNALRVADLSSLPDEIQEPPLKDETLSVTPEEIDLKVEEIVYEASSDSSESTEEDTYILPHSPWELENGELSYEEPQNAFFIKTEAVECEDDQGFKMGSEKDWRVPVGVKEDEERVSFERHKVVKTYGRRKK